VDLRTELAPEPLREDARSAARVEYPPGPALGDRRERDVLRVVARDELPIGRVALCLPLLARVLPLATSGLFSLRDRRSADPEFPSMAPCLLAMR
jgi:hypothetical protein